MINWSFKPTITPIEIVIIFLIAEFLVPFYGLWALLILLPFLWLVDRIETQIWEVIKIDPDYIEEITEAEADLELVIGYLKEMAQRGDGQAIFLLYQIGESDDFKDS